MTRSGFRGKRVEAKRAGMMAIASKELPVYTTEDNRLTLFVWTGVWPLLMPLAI
jgi:hypothetical protein